MVDTPKTFAPVLPEAEVDFVEIETQWLEKWNIPNADGRTIIDRYLTRNENAEQTYSFIDGPITANNPMGVHHAWGRTYKDLFLRFRNMQGFRQRFQNGYDGQGLWIEVEVEKEKGFQSKHEIETYGVDKFVTECKARVDHFSDIITRQSKRLGYFMQWDDSYHTKSDENNYTIWAFLKRCHENGWLYKGKDVMPWCPRCGTGMSQHEIATEGYAEIVHPGFFIRLPLIDREGEALLVWTTTPWTLAANVAAAVNPENDYVKVRNYSLPPVAGGCRCEGDSHVLWLSANRLHVLNGKHEILDNVKGAELLGWRYRGPFDDLEAQAEAREQHRVIEWEDVGDEEGTGIVHIAPGAGSEDFQLGRENDLPVIAPLDDAGVYIDGFGVLTGKSVDEVNPIIFDLLKESGVYYKVEDYSHRYPVCWRCNSQLVFRLVDEWFISMDELRHTMMDATRTIKWVPAFGEARELDWLRNMQDWMISKKRYYGLALPIYECQECTNVDVIGSRDELKERSAEGWEEFDGNSPHRPWIDEIKIRCSKCDVLTERIKDVGNAWLDAGIVSFSTLHYNDDRDYWRDWFPADWISESFPGQFRNWFYSLICMAAALEGVAPTKAVFSYGLMRDEKGEEMHKSKGNSIPFEDAADKMGADVMRWVFARHIPQNNLNFGYSVGDAARRRFVLPLWNIYYFFTTYARLDGWTPARHYGAGVKSIDSVSNELDRWAISELNALVRSVTDDLENWRIERASEAIETFVERLSNWYVRRSRRRFWKSEDDNDKQDAYNTLYTCLTTLSRLLAPIMPFISEEIYTNLVSRRFEDAPDSVHLSDWPTADESVIDDALGHRTNLAMRLASLGRSARSAAGIKVRQPLNALIVELNSPHEREALGMIASQLKDELNVQDVRDSSESDSLMAYRLRPNLPALGPKYGRGVNEIRNLLNEADATKVAASVRNSDIVSLGEFELNPDEILVDNIAAEGYAVESDGTYTVGISTEITPELRAEGYVRDIAHIVQNMRKNAGLEISDRIQLSINAPEGSDVATAIANHTDYIANETLAVNINNEIADNTIRDQHQLDGVEVEIGLARAT